jgi:hypothetical protein
MDERKLREIILEQELLLCSQRAEILRLGRCADTVVNVLAGSCELIPESFVQAHMKIHHSIDKLDLTWSEVVRNIEGVDPQFSFINRLISKVPTILKHEINTPLVVKDVLNMGINERRKLAS